MSRLLLICVLALACVSATRQQPPGRLIGPGERLRISVVGLMGEGVETRLLRRVGDDGSLRLPMLDADTLDATAMTAADLERDLTRRYERQSTRGEFLVVVSRIDLGEDHALTPGWDDLIGDPAVRVADPMRTMGDPMPPEVMRRVNADLLAFDDVPAREALARVGAVYALPLVIEWPSVELQGVDAQTPVTLTLPAGTRADWALSAILKQIGGGFAELGWADYRGAIVVGASELLDTYVETAVIDIRDLLLRAVGGRGDGMREEMVERIVTLITTTVQTDAWEINGGTIGRISELDGKLVVTATPEMLRQVAALLETLRGE